LDADCTNPKTCAVCNITEGYPLEHTWTEATCTTAKTCSTCSATDGEPLGHSLGEPVIVADYVEATQTSTVSCTVCDEVCDTKISDLERLHNGDVFLLSPQEFSDRFNNIIKDISPDCPYEVYYTLGIGSNEWSTWYIDEYLQKYNGNVVWRDENLSFYDDDEWRRMRFSAQRYFNFETTYHISGTYYSYSIRWNDPIGVIAGMEINLKNNAYTKDLMIALLMTFVPDLTPDVAWNIITDEDALQFMNPVPFVHNGVGIEVSYYSSQTGSIHIWDEADVFSVAVYPLPEDSPYNVEHGIAYP